MSTYKVRNIRKGGRLDLVIGLNIGRMLQDYVLAHVIV